ncbi:hypothetical protein BH09ACT5_BH09ACT5_20810 [soil metagenome]
MNSGLGAYRARGAAGVPDAPDAPGVPDGPGVPDAPGVPGLVGRVSSVIRAPWSVQSCHVSADRYPSADLRGGCRYR